MLNWNKMFRLIGCAVVLSAMAFGQGTATSGAIRGTVVDPKGAVVPNANVTVTNQATGLTRRLNTNSVGAYVVSDLPPGTYNMTFDSSGFKQGVIHNVVVNVSSVTEESTQLQVGNATEVVTVEANAVGVQTSSAAIGEVVDNEQATQLPLNGSNFVELTQIQPGVSASNNFSTTNKGLIGGVDFSVNGNPTTNNLFLIDGANNNDVGSNRTILSYPSIDAISEFKMLRNSYGPEYGQASGAIISISTKSGSNNWHGSVNYFGKNDALEAEDYFAKQANLASIKGGGSLPHNGKDELRRNDIIWSLGGPIKKDRLFFFVSQEFNREVQGFTRQTCAASAAELKGDFSGSDPCGQSKPTIPAGLQAAGNPFAFANPSPAGLAILAQLPSSNAALVNGNNWFLSTPAHVNYRDENFRVDFDLTNAEQLTFRYTQDNQDMPAPTLAANGFLWGDDPFPAIESNWKQPSRTAIAKITSTLSSTLVNEAQFSYSGNSITTNLTGNSLQLAENIEKTMPTIFSNSGKQVGGIPTFWGGAFGPSYNTNIWGIAPYSNNMDLYTVRDDLSKVVGNHSFKFGAFLSFNAKNEDQYGGQDRLSGASPVGWGVANDTGNTIANLLYPGQTFFGTNEQSINPVDQARWRDYEFYAGDTWKVTPRLTVEYGARWSLLREPFNANDAMGIFDPSTYNPAQAFVTDRFGNQQSNLCDGIVVVPGTSFCQQAAKLTGLPYTNGTPSKYGRSLLPNNNHDIAPRIGIAWDMYGNGKTALRLGAGQFYQRERVSTQIGLTNAPPFAINASANRSLDALPDPATISYVGSTISRVITSNTPNSWQWNMAVEQELARDTALELAYVGNKGLHLTTVEDLNSVLPQNRVALAFVANNAPKVNSGRPYTSWGSIWSGNRNGWSTYHALQTLFRTKVRDVVNLQAAYTWGHSISNTDLSNANGIGSNATDFTDPYNPNLDKGNSSINRSNMFVASTVWHLPRLQGQNGLLKSAFGGWDANSILTLEDGNSITVYANNGAGTGESNGLYGTTLSGNNRPLIVPGQSCTLSGSGNTVLNASAFTLNGFAIGTDTNPLIEPRGYCRAPAYKNLDFGLYKNFRVTERFNLQFRMDAFNAFNHVNFRGDQINTDWGAAATSVCGSAACSSTNNVITGTKINAVNQFGQATGDKGPRQFQYGLRLSF